jgi:hypothetical protein
MLSHYHHIARLRKEMAAWFELHLLDAYHKECINNAPAAGLRPSADARNEPPRVGQANTEREPNELLIKTT